MIAAKFSKTPAVSAIRAANYLIWHSQEHGDTISNLKLQKLLYYSHGWFLAIYKRLLFSEPIEAWVRGPVVRSVWREYNHYRWNPIDKEISEPDVTKQVREHLSEIMSVYGDHSAYTLESQTHKETPWLNARGDLLPKESSNTLISNDDMFAYFTKLSARKS